MLRFDKFMQHALHHPEKGYYARNISTVGQKGDFSTSATLSPILGKAIADRFLNTKCSTIIEVGAGDGSLANAVIQSLPYFKRLRIQYHIIETSTPLQQKQQTLLGKKIHWHSDIQDALKSCKGKAFIFSNELVDAFPVRIFKRSNSQSISELFIDQGAEVFAECIPSQLNSTALDDPIFKEGQRIEIHESYQNWMNQWLPLWKEGELLTIDYGDTYPKIYHRMLNGTLRGYSHHQHLTGASVYSNPGHQDITADVNFSDLMLWGKEQKLKTLSYTNQHEFLKPYLRQNNEADQFLINPHGAGSAFKVLIQTPS